MANITNDETSNPEMTNLRFEDAYDRLLPEMQSLGDDELLTVNLDIPSAVFTVIGIQPELSALRDDIAKMHGIDVERVLNVGVYARALGHAHALYLATVDPTDTLKALIEEGTLLRETLIADARALVQRKLMNSERLKELTTPIGYKNLAFDLEVLGAVFRAHFPKIQGKCGTTEADVDRAVDIAAAIAVVVGEREQTPARVAEAADMRTRAFTLFIRTYDGVRRAVTFLRWDKADVSDIAPSLYLNRGRRKEPVEGAAPTGPVTPIATDHGFTPTTDQPFLTAPAATPGPAAASPLTAPNAAVGTPNAGPFLA